MSRKTSNKPFEPMKNIDERESYIPHTGMSEEIKK